MSPPAPLELVHEAEALTVEVDGDKTALRVKLRASKPCACARAHFGVEYGAAAVAADCKVRTRHHEYGTQHKIKTNHTQLWSHTVTAHSDRCGHSPVSVL